jgi:hypothetical protein
VRLGSSVSFDVIVSDGAGAWHAQPFIGSIESRTSREDSPYQCTYSSFYEGTVCAEVHRGAVERFGSASGR